MSIIIGTSGANALTGTASSDLIIGLAGADTINGGGGNDIIDAGSGHDSVQGGTGSDLAFGGEGNDTLDGGADSDILFGGNGNDLLIYNVSENIGAADIYFGDGGTDTLRLVVSQAFSQQARFITDLANLNTLLGRGSASYQFSSFGLSVVAMEKLEIIVQGGGNRAPVAVADQVNAVEDTALTISAALLLANDTDADAGDTKTIIAVANAVGGTVALDAAGNIVFTPAANLSGSASFTYTMRDAAGATSSTTVSVTIAAVADAPTLSVVAAQGDEDAPIALSIASALVDTDGSETLSLTIAGLPAGATLNRGIANGLGGYTLSAADLAGLTLTPPANFSGTLSLTVTAISREASNGATANTTSTLTVSVAAVADAPTLSVAPADGLEDSAIALNIAGALTDTDGSESLIFTIAGLPQGASLNHGTADAAGLYTLTAADLAGLVLTPAANMAGSFALTVTATSREASNGATASTTASLAVTVAAVADAPSLGVAPANGNEDTAIALNIASALTDTDGFETLSLTVTGLPPGASLNNGVAQEDGSYLLAPSDLAGLTLTPAPNFAGNVSLTVTATSRETSNGTTATTSATLSVAVTAVADAPTLSAPAAAGNEDTAIALNIASALTDTDGSETLSLTISGVPDGASLNKGAALGGGNYRLSAGDLAGLTLTPPGDFAGNIALTVTAISREASNGSLAVSSATLNVSVAAMADAAAVTLQPAAGSVTSTSIPLSIAIATTDVDGSETVGRIAVSGVPEGYLLSAGFQDASGAWVLTPAQLAGLALVPPTADATAGSFVLTVSATTLDGASSTTTSSQLLVTIAPAANQQSGFAIDGYIAGATVFADANGNGVFDAGEASARTNADGSFTLTGGSGNLVMFGGLDTSTGAAFAGTLKAPAGSTVITPLTTLVVAIGGDVATAQASVKASLGLSASVDLTTFDAVAATAAGNANGAAVLGAAVQVQATITQIAAATGGSAASVVTALASTITAAAGTVDLADSATLGAIVTTVAPTAAPDAIAQVSAVVAAANTSIAAGAATGDPLTGIAQAAQVALGGTTQALATAALDGTALAGVVTNSTGTALSTQVAAAPVADVDGPTLGTIGADTLTGGAGVDAIDGLDGADRIDGGAGNDLLYGGGGADTLIGGAGDDRIDGGTGVDRAYYTEAAEAITVALAQGRVFGGASSGTDTLISVEGVRGTNFADSYDASGYNALTGYASGRNDQGAFNEFQGMGGDDTVIGNGQTRVSYIFADAGVNVNLATRTATGIASGDLAHVGNDSLGGGINAIRGSGFDDTLTGSTSVIGTEFFEGSGGNDWIDGNGGFDRVRYDTVNTGALGISINLAAGVVTGRDAAATAVIGTDTLRSIESVRGTNAADIMDATGFNASTSVNNGGDQGSFNEFEGMGGNDTLIGNGNSRVGYTTATAGVLVDMSASVGAAGAGTATGDASVGTDTFTGVTALRGSEFADTLIGSGNTTVAENFEGLGGNDSIVGGLGFDRARYDVNLLPLGVPLILGVTVQMATGIVTGRDAVATSAYGADTLRSIEYVRGTNANDIYDATNFGAGGFTNPAAYNVGSSGTLNEFEGLGGDDSITGNGNTRLSFGVASEGVNVNLGTGRVLGGASVGNDSFTGVNAINGSSFADTVLGGGGNASVTAQNGDDSLAGGSGAETFSGGNGNDTLSGGNGNDSLVGDAGNDSLAGDGNNDFLVGGLGNDSIDGGAGIDIAIINSARGASTITDLGGGVLQVVGTDGTDRFTNVEVLRFNDAAVLGSTVVSLVGRGGIGGANPTIFGSAGADQLTIDTGTNVNPIDLGAGADTLILGVSASYTLSLTDVETVTGTSGADIVTVSNAQSTVSFDLGAGADSLTLNGIGNTVTARNVETLITTGGNDIVTFFLDSAITTGTINLSFGIDSLTLGDNGGGGYTVSVANVETLLGSAAADTVTLTAVGAGISTSIDLAGGVDTLILSSANATYNLALTNVEKVQGGFASETLFLANTAGGVDIDLGTGFDTLNLGNFTNLLTVRNVEALNGGTGNDNVNFIPTLGAVNQSINLGLGSDSLNIGGTGTALSMSIFGGASLAVTVAVSGASLNLLNSQTGATYNMSAGAGDSLTLNGTTNVVRVSGAEFIQGSSTADAITVLNNANVTRVTGGFGADTMTAGFGVDHFAYNGTGDSPITGRDIIFGFDAAADRFVFASTINSIPTVFAGGITYIGTNAFSATGQLEAHIMNNGIQNILEIDVNGDGAMGVNDMAIELQNLVGTLTSANFLII